MNAPAQPPATYAAGEHIAVTAAQRRRPAPTGR